MIQPGQLALLDHLEREEAALLSWGYVDGGFTEQELSCHVQGFLDGDDSEAADATEDLLANHFVFRIRQGRNVLYRTRSAEAIRLFAMSRQLFPQHLVNGSWRTAPTLVSDFRFSLRARTYPERYIQPLDAAAAIAAGRNPFVHQVVVALLLRGETFRLARFQQQAAQQVLDDLEGTVSRGTIIGAGTGSGKTLAFYVPALAHIAHRVDSAHWTKGVAVYPRNELLKDQFSETLRETRRLKDTLVDSGRRTLLIGAFFGPTPLSADSFLSNAKWTRSGAGFVCPYLRCPNCGGELVWDETDIRADLERLNCSKAGCATVINDDEVVLTRVKMRSRPPDVLFTTTEMLNRQLSDSTNGHIFGVGPRAARKPELMLLDEVHTYEGTTGAQAAYVIRRWRHAIGRPVQFVGLSATLREPQGFFARLVGLADHAVSSVTPAANDLITEGMEYLVALRGDPVSATSLLSTTIQASMLLRRILDRDGAGVFGTRLFVFTDDLDVTNRLYWQLLDAEGRDSWGRPDRRGNGALAALRASIEPDHAERQVLGQAWDMCEAIGHHLDPLNGLRIGRTSSQDPGVTANNDIVVATASLDVGFNDPTVGAVLQHKAPLGAAQFLQRKGRAGRIRGMRPWTVVVLSDYGRDRLAYQGYDLLFDPALEATSLPTQNTYVLRIQAAFAFMDWLASKLPSHLRGTVWLDLAGPPQQHQPRSRDAAERQRLELEYIEQCLTDESVRQNMFSFVRSALQLTSEQTEVVAWEAPRSLMLEVLPTLRRRLSSGWSKDGIVGRDYQVRWQPVPDFVPANLFSDLNLPETRIVLPPANQDADGTEEMSPILQALRTFAPGRISRRYGVEHRYVRHWVPVPLTLRSAQLDLADHIEGAELGTFTFGTATSSESYRAVRPWAIRTEVPPQRLVDSTNATLDWRSRFEPIDDGDEVHIPSPSSWDEVADSLTVFTHARRSGVEITRLAVASRATLAFEGGQQSAVDATFILEGVPAALGFELDVDAIRLRARIPSFFSAPAPYQADRSALRSFRVAYFQHLVETDRALTGIANIFQLQWLTQLYLSVVVERALNDELDLQGAHASLAADSISGELQRVLDVIFQSLPTVVDPETPPDVDDPAPPRQRLQQALGALADDPSVVQRLSHLASVLWSVPDAEWERWAAERFAVTLGAAVLEGADRLCRDVGAQNLVLDTHLDEGLSTCSVWLSEPSIGGGGIIEEFAKRYADDPRRFFRLVESALAPSDFEVVDTELVRALDLARSDSDVTQQFAAVRAAGTQAAKTAAMRQLLSSLLERGVAVIHPVTAALNARVLRPGSSDRTDAVLGDLVTRWRAEEVRLGVEIDARVFAFVASASDDIDRAVPAVTAGVGDPRQRRFATIYGLLWPRGLGVRANALRAYNPYHAQPATDRALVLSALRATTQAVVLTDPDWRSRMATHLIENGAALLTATPSAARELRQAIMEVQGIPMDAGFLMLYPRVIGFERDSGELRVRLELREAFQ
jgi:hypothetical protein